MESDVHHKYSNKEKKIYLAIVYTGATVINFVFWYTIDSVMICLSILNKLHVTFGDF